MGGLEKVLSGLAATADGSAVAVLIRSPSHDQRRCSPFGSPRAVRNGLAMIQGVSEVSGTRRTVNVTRLRERVA